MKELIYLNKNALSPAGGPLGVGYYIYNEAKKHNDKEICFLDINREKLAKETTQKKILYKFKHLTRIVRTIRHILKYNKVFKPKDTMSDTFKKYDIVHFHSTIDMYEQRESLKKFKGITILTSHSPVPLSQELKDACSTNLERLYFKIHSKDFEKMDEWCFENANYIIFPCSDAEEPYSNNWPAYKEIKKKRQKRYKYVATGISERIAQKDKSYIRNQYGIGDKDFLISYAGRHNKVKGYDLLKDIAEKLLANERGKIKFIIAGRKGNIEPLDDESWKEIGFTKDPYSIIAASDIFILPNRETYFDLAMIEALSLGKIVVTSRTGGNKYYEKHKLPGVFLYDTIDEAVDLIEKIKNMKKNDIKELERQNRKFYEKHLTSDSFYKSYKKVINEIYLENKR